MQILEELLGSSSVPMNPVDFLLDIETTGLSKEKDAVISIGVVYKNITNQITSTRWFAESREDEKSLLEKFLIFSSAYKAIYTYNGKGFDIPFILSRLDFHHIDAATFKQLIFIDMKKVMSKMGTSRSNIEHAVGYQRQTTITGKELAALYKAYESSKLPTYQTLIINHHQDELGSLLAMYEVYLSLQHLTNYSLKERQQSDSLLILCLQTNFTLSTSCSIANEDISIEWNKGTDVIHLKVQLHQGAFKKYLTPAKDYYFIQDQNQLLHKSIAQFLPKESKQKVTPKQCFVLKEGTFVRLYSKLKVKEDIFYNEQDKTFIEYSEDESIISIIPNQITHLLFN